jgi:hypothetical protein
MTRFRIPLLLLASHLLAPICSAQVRGGTVEINPFAGYLFGGRFPQGTLATGRSTSGTGARSPTSRSGWERPASTRTSAAGS